MEVKRALTVANVLAKKVETIKFEGQFYDVFENPQRKGRWFVFGQSGSGKSSFVMQLIKEFAKTEKTLLVSKEEETDDVNLQDRLRLFRMQDVTDNFKIVEDGIEELNARLTKRNAPQVIFIDSLTYLFSNYREYYEFTRKHNKKLFVTIGHAEGMQPKSAFENDVNFDATQKVVVAGYVATNRGRKYGPFAKQFIVWRKGYEDLNGIEK